ncbi:DNA polymerase IV [Clostridium saccharobutylicum]|uniref:DNA polymerase IV n=1 Tax=Clostridium saccharobutylicum DSM 13864 TaxID=1345695 RepID=U5MWG0_CLOSA|nr:DNA polymerase IV [Clostridium saccharobutylicum]AGX44868.1 DNA polymerase IV [Clostridium saccharobutylicum DSM 13864]AQR92150.1 DNA polymerase IV [Clostridium saccharobutylicum]AQS02052.1 DNA polymerase IV [Clostridium saccharobutylicum]AQS11656.1 DNA polymerase IV [Clostridium saccharobutylicum]AQS16035.1 DNA polymerase IV [Clostridium saccharobutylicum]
MENKILHVDMDAFFASVEQRDNPELRGKPVIVGGVSERGVVSTCSYEARKYGVHSAMPIFMAREKCPNGIFVSGRYGKYTKVSQEIFKLFNELTPLVEPVSIDEGFLDLSEAKIKDGMEAARYIKNRVYREIGLTLSIGISYNKFLAKLASDWNKPNGIKEITKEMIPDILLPLSISKVHGLGKISVAKLNNMGIYYIKDLYNMPKEFYLEYLGKSGIDIYNRIRGIDNRKVEVVRERKSVGKERTLKFDTKIKEELLEYIKEFSFEIEDILSRKNVMGKTVTLKYKTKDFENHTRSKTLNYYVNTQIEIFEIAKELLEAEQLKDEIRLIGVSVSSFKENELQQITLF